MKLLLSSLGKIAVENIDLIWDKERNPKIAWVVTGMKNPANANFADNSLQALIASGYEFHLYDISEKGSANFERELKEYDILYVEGGSPFHLLKIFRETGFDKFVKEWVKEKLYIGISSGSYMLCPNLEMALWKKPDRNTYGLTDYSGLGVIDFLITCHYKDEFADFIKAGSNKSKFQTKILRDKQALLVIEDKVELIGDGEEVILD